MLWAVPELTTLGLLFRATWFHSVLLLYKTQRLPSTEWQELKVISSESQRTSLSVFLQPINKIRISETRKPSEVWTSQGYSFLNHSGKDINNNPKKAVCREQNFLMPQNSHFNCQDMMLKHCRPLTFTPCYPKKQTPHFLIQLKKCREVSSKMTRFMEKLRFCNYS